MKVLITASRNWTDQRQVWGALDSLLVDVTVRHDRLVVIHGDCPTGGDRHARQWCETRLESGSTLVAERRYPAKWEWYGKQAGFIRNQAMVDLMPDVCLAFVNQCRKCPRRDVHGSHGATDTITRCIEAGIPVREFREA